MNWNDHERIPPPVVQFSRQDWLLFLLGIAITVAVTIAGANGWLK